MEAHRMQFEPIIEIFRWGMVQIPAMIYTYAAELDLDAEDIGILGMVLFAHQRSLPYSPQGVEISQIMKVCPSLTKNRLSRRLSKWEKAGLITIEGNGHTDFVSRKLLIEPLYDRLREIVIRDHPSGERTIVQTSNEGLLKEQEERIRELEQALQMEKRKGGTAAPTAVPGSRDFRLVADFISQKTGNLISIKMGNEVRRWLTDFTFKPEFILCMLELCFERKINNPREITRIASGLKECSISNLEAMEIYFRTFVDVKPPAIYEFDPEVVEFGRLTGLDMSAEARKKVYYKWRYDWGFSVEMIGRAGEIMCNRTKNGGIDYVDGVLSNWKEKNIRSLADAEKESSEHKSKRKSTETHFGQTRKAEEEDREVYIPPTVKREESAVGK